MNYNRTSDIKNEVSQMSLKLKFYVCRLAQLNLKKKLFLMYISNNILISTEQKNVHIMSFLLNILHCS